MRRRSAGEAITTSALALSAIETISVPGETGGTPGAAMGVGGPGAQSPKSASRRSRIRSASTSPTITRVSEPAP